MADLKDRLEGDKDASAATLRQAARGDIDEMHRVRMSVQRAPRSAV